MRRIVWIGGLAALLGANLVFSSCSAFATFNEVLPDAPTGPTSGKASFEVTPRGAPDVMVVLALSGGGSRAAYLAGAVMLELESVFDDVNLLHEVDAISAVSGGGLAAAYYCLSRDPEGPDDGVRRRIWNADNVHDLLSRDYVSRWIGNMLWPTNVLLYWFTAFDRTDIMAQTLADNLFDHPITGGDFTLGELAGDRPNLLLNATDATETSPPWVDDAGVDHPREPHYGNVFTFTREDFGRVLGSDVDRYSVARAVMASASFPSAFQYMTMRDFRSPDEERYVHLFDGGNADNLGLTSVERLLREIETEWPAAQRPERYVVVSVDAYTSPRGVDRHSADPRGFLDYVIDTNFLDTIDVLMAAKRLATLERFTADESALDAVRRQAIEDAPEQWTPRGNMKDLRSLRVRDLGGTAREAPPEAAAEAFVPRDLGDRLVFWHLDFTQVPDADLRRRLNGISTNFRLPDGAAQDLERAAHAMVRDADELARVRAALGLAPRDPSR